VPFGGSKDNKQIIIVHPSSLSPLVAEILAFKHYKVPQEKCHAQ